MMNTDKYEKYVKKLILGCEKLDNYASTIGETDDSRDLLYSFYCDNRLDPDGYARREICDVDCTADGLLTFYQICRHEEQICDIVSVYRDYGRCPMIFFPCEVGGINTSRARAFWDRIDHALFDLKNYFGDRRTECYLAKAYNRPITKKWLDGMGSFENIVDWWGVKGIFTDSDYNVYDLEMNAGESINDYRSRGYYKTQWSQNYYNNLKECISWFQEQSA